MYHIYSERRKEVGIRKEEMGSQNMSQTYSLTYKTGPVLPFCPICHSEWLPGLLVKVHFVYLLNAHSVLC
jgi:hypothetical protein